MMTPEEYLNVNFEGCEKIHRNYVIRLMRNYAFYFYSDVLNKEDKA